METAGLFFFFFPVDFHSDGFFNVLAVHCVDESGQQRQR
jgi:hypothetical protein